MRYASMPGGRRLNNVWLLFLLGALCWLALPAAFWNQLEPTAHAATFNVTNTNDSGSGSLREAITLSNLTASDVRNRITFDIPGAGVKVIQLASALPTITNPVEIDGSTQGNFFPNSRILIDGGSAGEGLSAFNIAAGNSVLKFVSMTGIHGFGVTLKTNGGNLIFGNSFGPDLSQPSGSTLFQGTTGINIELGSDGNTIEQNTISQHNSEAILVASNGNTVDNNRIRENNGDGIFLSQSNNNRVYSNLLNQNVGAGLLINGFGNYVFNNDFSENKRDGLVVAAGVGNKITGNFFRQNSGIGMDLLPAGPTPNDPSDTDTGANNLQNFPVLTSAFGGSEVNAIDTTVAGTLNSTPNTDFRIELYVTSVCNASGRGADQRYLGDVNAVMIKTGSDGNATFSASNIPAYAGQYLTATAISEADGASEFSQCRLIEGTGLLRLKTRDFSFDENAGTASITVERYNGSTGTVSVDYATEAGTATAGADYQPQSGTLTFASGETSKTFSIPLIDDTLTEGTEFVNLKLSNPQNTQLNLFHSEARLVLFDNESPRPPNLIGLSYGFSFTYGRALVRFNSDAPGELKSLVALSGLAPTERIESIAIRPLNGKLYGLGSSSRLYLLDPQTGAAQAVNSTPFIPLLTSFPVEISFNPVTDRLRVVTLAGENFQLNPDTGQVVSIDTKLAYAAGDPNASRTPSIVSLAHDNYFTGATSTTTYGVNFIGVGAFPKATLVRLGSVGGSPIKPETGQLFTVTTLNGNYSQFQGFDIGDNNTGYYIYTEVEQGFSYLSKISLGGAPAGPTAIMGDDVGPIIDLAVELSPRLQFRHDLFSVNENAGAATITVRRTGNTDGLATVNYSTSDGTATAGIDYTATSGTLTFAPGETTQTFSISLQDDSLPERVETVKLKLTSATGVVLGPQVEATLAIMDEPTEAGTNPIDNAEFFVRQHYLDFLGREPDPGGLAFWTNNITKCGGDSACIQEWRIGTSAAFFIENEFQQTGSFVYRLYKGGLGRQPTYGEFSADRQQVVAGAGLDANKAAFADQFVQRAAFTTKYEDKTTAESFVDALIATIKTSSGADLSSQRAALISAYNSGGNMTQSRSLTIRAAIEDASFKQAEYNPSFVLMQYFGYLRRDPEPGGYLFWLNVLNNKEPGNYRGMVCSFITSAEYQQRFGTMVTRTNRDCK